MRVRGSAVAGKHRKLDSRRTRPRLVALGATVALLAGLAVSLPLTAADATQATGDDVAVWSTGWSWTYQQTFNYNDGKGTYANIDENVTYTVAGTATFQSQSAYKLTLSGNITGGSGSAQGYKIDSFGGNVSGTEYIRRSDLALLQEDQTQHLTATAHQSFLSVGVTADVHLVLTPTPGWETLAFPLNSGDSWAEHETIDYSGSFSYNASGLTSGGGPLNGSFDFAATAHDSATTVSVPIGSVATDAVTAHDTSNGAQDDQWWSPHFHNLAKEHLAIPLNGATATLDRTLNSASTPAPSTTMTEAITPSLTCAGGTVNVAGKLSSGASGQALTITLDQSPASAGRVTTVHTSTSAGGAYTATLPVPKGADGLGKSGARATWGVLVDGGGAGAAATLVVGAQDCTTLTYTGATTATIGAPATVSAKLVDQATGKPVSGQSVSFALSDGGTVAGTTGADGVATASLPVTVPARSAQLAATFAGTAGLAGSSTTAAIEVNKAATSTALTPSANSIDIEHTTTFTATVTPAAGTTPTGTVQFVVDGTNFGAPVALSGGVATSAPFGSGIALGSHQVTAVYGGSDSDLGSTSPAVTVLVHKVLTKTGTTLSVQPDTSVYGQDVTLTATVSDKTGGGTPTGTVTFNDGDSVLGSATLTGGTASFTAAGLAVGNHGITATYSGDDNYDTSASAPANASVARAQTSVAVVSGNGSTVTGQAVVFTAAVAAVSPGSGQPDGSVQLQVDGTEVGDPVTLDGGVAVFPAVTDLTAGSHAVTAVYSGSSDFAGSAGSATQDVAVAQTATVLTATPSPAAEEQDVTLTAVVAAQAPGAGEPTGTVTFFDGGTPIGSGTLADVGGTAQASLTTADLAAGDHQLTASYAGDDNYAASDSPAVKQTVLAAAAVASTTTTLSSSANPSTYGQPITFTAAVANDDPTGDQPSGTVQFAVDGTNVGDPVPLAGGSATSPVLYSPEPGDHFVTAQYLPTAAFSGSGDSLTQHVDGAKVGLTLTSTAAPSEYGQAVHFHVVVAADAVGVATPGGVVQFRVDGQALGLATALSHGAADSPAIDTLTPGEHTVTVLYGGDTGYLPATTSITQTVGRIATQTALSSSNSAPVYGQPVTFTATVTPATTALGEPDGTVTFTDGGTVLGAVPVAAGTGVSTATLTTDALGAGTHAITATYTGGDTGYFAGSASAPLSQQVAKAATAISADPAVVQLVPLGLPLGTLRATLTSANGPLAGRTLVFTIGSLTACRATTDDSGVATCNARQYLLNLTLGLGYHVAFAGDPNYLAASGQAGLL